MRYYQRTTGTSPEKPNFTAVFMFCSSWDRHGRSCFGIENSKTLEVLRHVSQAARKAYMIRSLSLQLDCIVSSTENFD